MKKMLLMLMVIVYMSTIVFLPVQASSEVGQDIKINELNQVMFAQKTLDAKENPDDSANTVVTYESGSPVYVLGETADGWYKVLYQGKNGYVHMAELTMEKPNIVGTDTEDLSREMENVEMESKLVVEEVERYREERKRSRIWGAAIIFLVVGIFTTGIISTIKANKEKVNEN